MTSGQETERVYCYNTGACAGSCVVKIDPFRFLCTRKIPHDTRAYQSLCNERCLAKGNAELKESHGVDIPGEISSVPKDINMFSRTKWKQHVKAAEQNSNQNKLKHAALKYHSQFTNWAIRDLITFRNSLQITM